MSVDIALETLRLQKEFKNSVDVLEDVRTNGANTMKHKFIVEDGVAQLISGILNRGHAFHLEVDVSLVAPTAAIIDDFLATHPLGFGHAEDYVLGLYMHDPQRNDEIVTALGMFVKEGFNDV